jgi:hypothetical protein
MTDTENRRKVTVGAQGVTFLLIQIGDMVETR